MLFTNWESSTGGLLPRISELQRAQPRELGCDKLIPILK